MEVFNLLYAILLAYWGTVCPIKRSVCVCVSFFLSHWWQGTMLCKNVKFYSKCTHKHHTLLFNPTWYTTCVVYGVAYGKDVCKMQIKRCKSWICRWQTIGLCRFIVVVVVCYWVYWMLLHERWKSEWKMNFNFFSMKLLDVIKRNTTRTLLLNGNGEFDIHS